MATMQQAQSAQVHSQNARNFLSDVGTFISGLNPFNSNNNAFDIDRINAQMLANEAKKSKISMPSFESNIANGDSGFISIGDAINNWFTGNADWNRTLEALKREQEFSAEQAQIARDFQKYMAEHSHQIEAADLQAIGLNPALTLTSGGANAYSAASASSPGARDFKSGKGFDAMLSLIMGLLSLNVNNARKIDALDKSLNMADKKLNATMIQNDAKLDAMAAHWNAQDSVAKMKLASYDYMNLEKAAMYKNYLDNLSKFKKNWK